MLTKLFAALGQLFGFAPRPTPQPGVDLGDTLGLLQAYVALQMDSPIGERRRVMAGMLRLFANTVEAKGEPKATIFETRGVAGMLALAGLHESVMKNIMARQPSAIAQTKTPPVGEFLAFVRDCATQCDLLGDRPEEEVPLSPAAVTMIEAMKRRASLSDAEQIEQARDQAREALAFDPWNQPTRNPFGAPICAKCGNETKGCAHEAKVAGMNEETGLEEPALCADYVLCHPCAEGIAHRLHARGEEVTATDGRKIPPSFTSGTRSGFPRMKSKGEIC